MGRGGAHVGAWEELAVPISALDPHSPGRGRVQSAGKRRASSGQGVCTPRCMRPAGRALMAVVAAVIMQLRW